MRKGDLLATVSSREEVMTLVGRFIQHYRESANWLERTYDFVPRVGLGAIRQALEEHGAELDAGIQRSIDAYRDPWGQDGPDPATPGQFRTALPLVALPEVPVR